MFGMPKFGLDHKLEKGAEIEKPKETEVRLEIMRHSKKENDPNRPNSELLLTSEGRELAQEKGKELNPDIKVAVAGASPMDRAAETAMLAMMASEDKIKVDDSLAEMENKISEELKVGKKLYRDERLGFNLDGPIHDEGMSAFKEGKYMEWLTNDSDKQAIMKGDAVSSTYLRQAGNIAELVTRYEQVGSNFNHLATDKDKEGAEFPSHLERYLVTHQGVAECFVAEVIKEELGETEKQKFVANLKNGWAEMKGISLQILNKGQEQTVRLSYQDEGKFQELLVKAGTIAKIINRRNTFEDAVKTSLNVAGKLNT